ncbi:hypothetical protein ACLKA7_004258 [Drosophila subpalustris]
MDGDEESWSETRARKLNHVDVDKDAEVELADKLTMTQQADRRQLWEGHRQPGQTLKPLVKLYGPKQRAVLSQQGQRPVGANQPHVARAL